MRFWKKNGKGGIYKGTYERDSKGERVFILSRVTGSARRITFESWQMAKAMKWKLK